jgi:hypothetical protein
MSKKVRGALLAATATLVVAAGIGGAAAPSASALTGQTWVCCSLTYVHPSLAWKVAPAAHNVQIVQADLTGWGCADSILVWGGALQGAACLNGGAPAGGWVSAYYSGADPATGVIRPNGGWGALSMAQIWW